MKKERKNRAAKRGGKKDYKKYTINEEKNREKI